MRRRIVFALFVACLLIATSAHAEPPDHCKTPRAAVESVFGWLAPDVSNPQKAARCLDPLGRPQRDLRESALRIKAIYDARALRIDASKLSDEPGWVNPETGRQVFAPHRALPDIVVERQEDGMWRWTRPSLDRVDEIYGQSLGNERL